MPVLVDTSAWIEFFQPKGSAAVKRMLVAALAEGIVVTVAPVLVELLTGLDRDPGTHRTAIERLRELETVDLSWDVCAASGELGRRLSRRGQRAPTVDLMIAAAALAAGHDLWHAGDKHFAALERAGGPRQRDLSSRDV